MARWLVFIIAILLGISAGLFYGWEINPIEYSNTTLINLKEDYQADFVLMIAEIFSSEADLSKAVQRLSSYREIPPGEIVQQAIRFGEKAGYAKVDLEKLRILYTALEEKP